MRRQVVQCVRNSSRGGSNGIPRLDGVAKNPTLHEGDYGHHLH